MAPSLASLHVGRSRFRSGFTLVEIIAVLIVLGALSALAVAKYYDLQREAEIRALLAVKNEALARLMHLFGQAVLMGKTMEHPAVPAGNRCEKLWFGAVDDFNMAPGDYEQSGTHATIGDIRVWLSPLAGTNYNTLHLDFLREGKPVLPDGVNMQEDPWLIHSPCP